MDPTFMAARHALRAWTGIQAGEAHAVMSTANVSSDDILPSGGSSIAVVVRRQQGVQAITRGQFRLFNEIGEAIRLTSDDRRRVLALTETEWMAWLAFSDNGPMPQRPSLSDMLQRLGYATFRLSLAAEGHRLDS
jgi:hypothetical protein